MKYTKSKNLKNWRLQRARKNFRALWFHWMHMASESLRGKEHFGKDWVMPGLCYSPWVGQIRDRYSPENHWKEHFFAPSHCTINVFNALQQNRTIICTHVVSFKNLATQQTTIPHWRMSRSNNAKSAMPGVFSGHRRCFSKGLKVKKWPSEQRASFSGWVAWLIFVRLLGLQIRSDSN